MLLPLAAFIVTTNKTASIIASGLLIMLDSISYVKSPDIIYKINFTMIINDYLKLNYFLYKKDNMYLNNYQHHKTLKIEFI